MSRLVNKSVNSRTFEIPVAEGQTTSSAPWAGEVRANFQGEFDTQTEAEQFVTKMTTSLQRMTTPTTDDQPVETITDVFNFATTSDPNIKFTNQ